MMFASVIRTLAWSFLFCFIATTLWSMVAVELIHPIVQELAEEGEFHDCKHCVHAFSSILQSNLTFLQTMLAGDSWGQIAMPVLLGSHKQSIFNFAVNSEPQNFMYCVHYHRHHHGGCCAATAYGFQMGKILDPSCFFRRGLDDCQHRRPSPSFLV